MTSTASDKLEPPATLIGLAEELSAAAFARAETTDHDGAFPADDISISISAACFAPLFPVALVGAEIGFGNPQTLRRILIALGRSSLVLGRLYEGHVNAAALVARYGTGANLELLKAEADAGRPTGVWMAGEPL